MTKQKVVMKLWMGDAKKRSKALKTVAGFEGVISAAVEEEKIVVVGDGVDSVDLTKKLRKKMGCVELISVTEEKKPDSDAKKPDSDAKKPDDKAKKVTDPADWAYPPPPGPPYAYVYEIQAEQPPCCRIV